MTRSRRIMPGLLVLAAGLAASCSVPTDAPYWDTRWIVPGDSTRIGIAEYLPGQVTVTGDGARFAVAIDPFQFSRSLDDICPDCGVLNGLTVPKPAFTAELEGSESLPERVLSADLAASTVDIRVTNALGFDPIRPAAGTYGSLTLTLYAGPNTADVLAQLVVDGADQAFPSGTTLERTLTATTGSVTPEVRVVLAVDSPAGDPVTIDTSARLDVEVTVPAAEFSRARIEVAGEEVSVDDTELDVGDVDRDLVDHVRSGALVLLVDNPLQVAVDMTVRISGPFPDIVKEAAFSAAPASTTRIDYSGEELRTFLGESGVVLSGEGTVDPAAPPVTVTPRDSVRINARIDAVFRVGD